MKTLLKILVIVAPSVTLLMMITCCAPQQYNKPLVPSEVHPNATAPTTQDDRTLVFATFSGGGSRALAMGYYVCQELEKVRYSEQTNLMQEIDYASGVSGGSFVAAALPIYKNDWQRFEKTAVQKNIQGNITARLFIPWNWLFLLSAGYTRTNIASEYYDKYIFERKTFGDLAPHPKVYINATLLAQGTHFVYTDKYFRYIGSDINSYPVGYACAASSAFPVGFPAMTLKNHGHPLPQDSLLLDLDYLRAYRNAEADIDLYTHLRLRDFLNDKRNRWLHNQDGGLAGNTGIERVLDEWKTNGVINKAVNNTEHPLKRMVVLIVDAGTDKNDQSCLKKRPPTSLKVLLYATTTAMDVLSKDRITAISKKMEDLWQTAHQTRTPLVDLEKPYLIEINARNIQDPALADKFNQLPTSFYLDTEQIETVRKTVKYLVKSNKEYQRLLESIKRGPMRIQ